MGNKNFESISFESSGKCILRKKFGQMLFNACDVSPVKEYEFAFFMLELLELDRTYDEIIAKFLYMGGEYPAIVREKSKLIFLFNPLKLIHYQLEKSIDQKKPFYLKVPCVYKYSSMHFHLFMYKLLTRLLKLSNFNTKRPYPAWPIDYSLNILIYLLKQGNYELQGNGIVADLPKTSVVCLSHDVDDRGGYANLEALLDVEREFNVFSTVNIPGARYKVDISHLKELESQGFEIGIHGYQHQNETPFLSEKLIEERVLRSLERFSALAIKGYRSPALRRTGKLFKILEKHFEYDSSIADTENCAGERGFSGSALGYPFFYNKLLEIPITMPQDGVLIMLGYSPGEMLEIWKQKAAFLKQLGVPIVVNTHPDLVFSGTTAMRQVYKLLLQHLTSDAGSRFFTTGGLNNWIRKTAVN